jgi:hypothetical protein
MGIKSVTNRRNIMISGMLASIVAFSYEAGNITRFILNNSYDKNSLIVTSANIILGLYILLFISYISFSKEKREDL